MYSAVVAVAARRKPVAKKTTKPPQPPQWSTATSLIRIRELYQRGEELLRRGAPDNERGAWSAAVDNAMASAFGRDSPEHESVLSAQAFTAINAKTTQTPPVAGEHSRSEMQRSLYSAACAVNRLRNKQGIGHGRPFLPDLTEADTRVAIQIMGTVAELLP